MLGTEPWAQPLGPRSKALYERPLSYTTQLISVILVIVSHASVDLHIQRVGYSPS